jgi:hypothetical protein
VPLLIVTQWHADAPKMVVSTERTFTERVVYISDTQASCLSQRPTFLSAHLEDSLLTIDNVGSQYHSHLLKESNKTCNSQDTPERVEAILHGLSLIESTRAEYEPPSGNVGKLFDVARGFWIAA